MPQPDILHPTANRSTLTMEYMYSDGGRNAAGFDGKARDCVTRAIAIATGKDYRVVYDELNALGKEERLTKRMKKRSSARTGVHRKTYQPYLEALGWRWVPTMKVGEGCTTHLRPDEIPSTGAIICRVSRHVCTVIDGVLHDNHDSSREGSRCVYGYFIKEDEL